MTPKIQTILKFIGLIGAMQLTQASPSIIKMENKGEAITLQIENELGWVQDKVTLKKGGNQLVPTSGEIYTAVHVDGANPQRIKIQYGDLVLEFLPNGELLLSGKEREALLLSYNSNAKVEKGKTLNLANDCLLQGFNQFENAGTMEMGHDLTTEITAFVNNGELNIGRAWQDMALKYFDNGATGKIALQRADFMSPAVNFTNKGTIACVGDWNGAGCALTNASGGQFNIGGNCTLKQLSNFSQTEPQLKGNGAFDQISMVYKNKSGGVLNPVPSVLSTGSAHYRDNDQGYHYNGYQKVITSAQNFTRREGARSQMYVGRMLVLMAGTSSNKCSDLFIGQDFVVNAGQFQNIGWHLEKTETCSTWKQTGHERHHKAFHNPHHDYYYGFANPTSKSLNDGELIAANTYVMGKASGNIQSITNGKVDANRAAIAKTTSTALKAKKAGLEAFVGQQVITPKIDWDLGKYEEGLKRLKANPTIAYWTELQRKRVSIYSNPQSAVPSRVGSPKIK